MATRQGTLSDTNLDATWDYNKLGQGDANTLPFGTNNILLTNQVKRDPQNGVGMWKPSFVGKQV